MISELVADTPHSVRDGTGRRYPVVDNIPYLRDRRVDLANDALDRLDHDDRDGALTMLLADHDDWWHGPVADPTALKELVARRDQLTLRDAMRLLAWGPVADYFAHRWSDPTFLAGIALVEAHWVEPHSAFEVACGIGHHLRALAQLGVAVTGTDVVFAKLWLAHHWVVPQAELICLDAAQVVPDRKQYDLVSCHDALYFLEPKGKIVENLRSLLDPVSGLLAISHVHNVEVDNFSSGAAISALALAELLPDALLYDDAELTSALIAGRPPRSAHVEKLRSAEAFAAVAGPALRQAKQISDMLGLPPTGTIMQRNPLYDNHGRIAWPSERYGREYGPRATYPTISRLAERMVLDPTTMAAARRRELVELPERW